VKYNKGRDTDDGHNREGIVRWRNNFKKDILVSNINRGEAINN
jgi:hypothetical protein